ncbi:MAG TPA: VWA domain-containing protein [Spirochaetota bacterium]|nr:VWA domain-containing protein [Spirochaetota bacterium]
MMVVFMAAALFLSFQAEGKAASVTNKDVVLVLDTSLSMIGYQGRNIMDDVKKSVYTYIDSLQDGDRVTFVTFDEDVKIYPQVVIDDQNDRDIVKKYISVTEAKGQWTYTLKMLQTVFGIADTLTKENQEQTKVNPRNVVIVIMTDGLDDPPPAKSSKRFDLKKIAEQYSGNDWWIYLVNLAEMEKSKEISAAHQKLKDELSKISENTTFIDGQNPDKAINEDLQRDIEQKEWSQFKKILPFIILLLLLVLIIALVIMKRASGVKVKGSLDYWNHELLKPDVLNVSLTALNMKSIPVGRAVTVGMRIREFESRNIFTLKAVREKGVIRIKIIPDEGLEVGFKNKDFDGYLNDGDIFSGSNFSFRYNA